MQYQLGRTESEQCGIWWSHLRRCSEPSRCDLESLLDSGETRSNAVLRVGALLMVAETGAVDQPVCMYKQGLIST